MVNGPRLVLKNGVDSRKLVYMIRNKWVTMFFVNSLLDVRIGVVVKDN